MAALLSVAELQPPTRAHSLSSAPFKPHPPRAEQLQDPRGHSVTAKAVWMCGGATVQILLVCTKDWHRLKLCWLPSGLRTSMNTLCTTVLLFNMKAEGNLDPLLVATRRAGSRAVSSICSPAAPFPTGPTDETATSQGRLTLLRSKDYIAQFVYLLKHRQCLPDIVSPM